MRLAMLQHAAHRAQRVALQLEVGMQTDQEFLDLLGCLEGAQHRAFPGGQAQLGGFWMITRRTVHGPLECAVPLRPLSSRAKRGDLSFSQRSLTSLGINGGAEGDRTPD